MGLQNWLRKLRGDGEAKGPEGADHRHCAACGHEISGIGVAPTSCPKCGQVLRVSA